MGIKPKIPHIIATLAVLGLLAYAYPIVKNRYFSQPDQVAEVRTEVPVQTGSDAQSPTTGQPADAIDSTDSTEEGIVEEEIAEVDIVEDDSFLEILPEDCANSCKSFDETEDVQYCKEYCGLISSKKTAADCGKFEDLEKDYCLKDEAVQKKDAGLCTAIEDGGIRKACRNRITEDILDAAQTAQ